MWNEEDEEEPSDLLVVKEEPEQEEDPLEAGREDYHEVFSNTGWSVTIGDDLPPCPADLASKGFPVCLSPLDKNATEDAVRAARAELPGKLFDWHWAKNKIILKCNNKGDVEAVKGTFLRHCKAIILKRQGDDDAMERRAENEGKRFNERWGRED